VRREEIRSDSHYLPFFLICMKLALIEGGRGGEDLFHEYALWCTEIDGNLNSNKSGFIFPFSFRAFFFFTDEIKSYSFHSVVLSYSDMLGF